MHDLVAQLRATLAKMETALGTLAESLVWIDEQGKIQWCNRGFDRLVGRAHITVLGARIADLLPVDLLQSAPPSSREPQEGPVAAQAHPYRRILDAGSLGNTDYLFCRGNESLTLQVSGSRWQLGSQPPIAIMAIQDITARKRAEQAQREAELACARAEKDALEKEMWIAHRIQTALLPREIDVPGYAIAGRMFPAESVGGDYYDVLAFDDGPLWLAIGDVTSHGVTPGLIMMMARSALAALTVRDPMATPSRVLRDLNRVIYDNVRERLRDNNHMTLTLLRSDGPGRFLFAGAHLDIVIRRAKDGQVSLVPTPGTWIGLVPDVEEAMPLGSLDLEPGDVMVLYTDGVTEAASADGRMFEAEGIIDALRPRSENLNELCDRLVAAVRTHGAVQIDDITVLCVQRLA